eukprot:m.174196 g.174196  ORF g.174196 m.174196 type:complete len:2218 (-) comp15404_c0_seq5:2617-9270(-)
MKDLRAFLLLIFLMIMVTCHADRRERQRGEEWNFNCQNIVQSWQLQYCLGGEEFGGEGYYGNNDKDDNESTVTEVLFGGNETQLSNTVRITKDDVIINGKGDDNSTHTIFGPTNGDPAFEVSSSNVVFKDLQIACSSIGFEVLEGSTVSLENVVLLNNNIGIISNGDSVFVDNVTIQVQPYEEWSFCDFNAILETDRRRAARSYSNPDGSFSDGLQDTDYRNGRAITETTTTTTSTKDPCYVAPAPVYKPSGLVLLGGNLTGKLVFSGDFYIAVEVKAANAVLDNMVISPATYIPFGVYVTKEAENVTIGGASPVVVTGTMGTGLAIDGRGTTVSNFHLTCTDSNRCQNNVFWAGKNETSLSEGIGVHVRATATGTNFGNDGNGGQTRITGFLQGLVVDAENVSISRTKVVCARDKTDVCPQSFTPTPTGIQISEVASYARIGGSGLLGTVSVTGFQINIHVVAVNCVLTNLHSECPFAPNTTSIGIWVDEAAKNTIIGEGGKLQQSLVTGSCSTGVLIDGKLSMIFNTIVGFRNIFNSMKNGIVVGPTGENVQIGSYQGADSMTYVIGCTEAGVRSSGDDLVVVNSNIGIDTDNLTVWGNGVGILLEGGKSPTIGSNDMNPMLDMVVISGNTYGIYCNSATTLLVKNVIVGLDRFGTRAVPNTNTGIEIATDCVQATLGFPGSYRPIVGGNLNAGIRLEAPSTTVKNAFIGVALDGETALGNGEGIDVRQSASGSTVSDCVVSGNDVGITISAPEVSLNSLIVGSAKHRNTAVPNQKEGIIIGRTATGCTLGDSGNSSFIGHNGRHGLHILGTNVTVQHTHVVNNSEIGIYVDIDAEGCVLGGTNGLLQSEGNLQGVVSEAPGTKLQNLFAGSVVGNGNKQDGIFIEETAVGTAVGTSLHSVICSGNLGNGLNIAAPHVIVVNSIIGLTLDASMSLGNQRSGIVVQGTATATQIGSNTSAPNYIGGNCENGVRVEAQNVSVDNTIIGISMNDTMVGNKQNGISVASTALNCVISNSQVGANGDASGLDSVCLAQRVSRHEEAVAVVVGFGIISNSSLKVSDVHIGVNKNGSTSVGNWGGGILLYSSATNTHIQRCVISANNGDGVLTFAEGLQLESSVVGLNAEQQMPLGNLRNGIFFVDGVTTFSLNGNAIGGNLLEGVRVGDVADLNAFKATLASQNNVYSAATSLGNGLGMSACIRCECVNNTINCLAEDLQATTYFELGYGDQFPLNIPPSVTSFTASGVGLTFIDWVQLQTLADLETLDISVNPQVSAVPSNPEQSFASAYFPSLRTLRLSGLDLSETHSNMFLGMDKLSELDLSMPSKPPPSNTVMNLTGLTKLLDVLWYDTLCPPGYFDNSKDCSSITMCSRCPANTEKTGTGGTVSSCSPCAAGFFDHDSDASTACIAYSDLEILGYDRDKNAISSTWKVITQFETLNIFATKIAIVAAPIRLTTIRGNATHKLRYFMQRNNESEGAATDLLTYINSDTGGLLLQSQIPGKVDISLFVQDPITNGEAVLDSMTVEFRDVDSSVANFGPNGKACQNGGVAVDTVAFDGSFTCDCVDGYSGENCENEDNQIPLIAGLSVALVVLVLLIVFGILWHKHKTNQAIDFEEELEKLISEGRVSLTKSETYEVPREIKRSCVALIEKIGGGAFGDVYKALLDESKHGGLPEFTVAAKIVKEDLNDDDKTSANSELVVEATLMSQVKHSNLVSVVGIVTKGDPIVLLISYCENGSLLHLLRQRKELMDPLALPVKLVMGAQIATGLEHLHSRKFVHRDLAARNVLVTSRYECKVSDFGLSRAVVDKVDSSGKEEDAYYRSQAGVFPIRWTAPEAMQTLQFSYASDVWAFGIVMVELVGDGEIPYKGLGNDEVYHKVIGGHVHPRPTDCHDKAWNIMKSCWENKPSDRPSFAELRELLVQTASSFGRGSIASVFQMGAKNSLVSTNHSGLNPYEDTRYEYLEDTPRRGSEPPELLKTTSQLLRIPKEDDDGYLVSVNEEDETRKSTSTSGEYIMSRDSATSFGEKQTVSSVTSFGYGKPVPLSANDEQSGYIMPDKNKQDTIGYGRPVTDYGKPHRTSGPSNDYGTPTDARKSSNGSQTGYGQPQRINQKRASNTSLSGYGAPRSSNTSLIGNAAPNTTSTSPSGYGAPRSSNTSQSGYGAPMMTSTGYGRKVSTIDSPTSSRPSASDEVVPDMPDPKIDLIIDDDGDDKKRRISLC